MLSRFFCLFFQILFIHISFAGKFAPKILSSSNWLKSCKGVHCFILITILMFIFPKCLIFFALSWSQNLKFSKLTAIWYRDTLLHTYYDFNVYFFKILIIFLWANLVPKSEVLQFNWNLVQGYIAIFLLHFCVYFFKIIFIHIFLGQILSENLKFFILTEIL